MRRDALEPLVHSPGSVVGGRDGAYRDAHALLVGAWRARGLRHIVLDSGVRLREEKKREQDLHWRSSESQMTGVWSRSCVTAPSWTSNSTSSICGMLASARRTSSGSTATG